MKKPFRLACLVFLLPAAAACAPRPLAAGPGLIRAEPLGSAQAPLPERLGRLELDGAWVLSGSEASFGGISAARWDGDRLLLLSDRSRLFVLGWPAHARARPFTAPVLEERALADRHGRPLDAEALVLLPGDTRLVADEGQERLWRFAPGREKPEGAGRPLPELALSDASGNEGVEALARLPGGDLLAIREATSDDGLHPAVRLEERTAQRLRYRAAEGFRPTDADAAGSHLFVLERRVSLLSGWQARIVAVPLATLPHDPAGIVTGQELAVLSGPQLGENYEALAVRKEGDAYRLLVAADDNFNPLQRTLLLELRWRPDRGETEPPDPSVR
ncbi:esterase-like activity of phytase family protein [Benzoatithermus flavus]|uniref:Esterase-like activity of phytase family protein n=1 Tax=Benzoatithermus flavus TaxID=3108223 RepID=A0ABU8XWA3_9PROT